jgi:hypothetical protein
LPLWLTIAKESGMKKYLLILLFCLAVPIESQAFVFVDIPYTGRVAEKTSPSGQYVANSTGGYMGGPASNGSLGGAFQFRITQSINIDWLVVDARAVSRDPSRYEAMNFDFKLYWGTTKIDDNNWIPNTSTLAYKTTAYFKDDLANDRYFDDKMVKFDQTLKPGTYWLAREDNGSGRDLIVDEISPRFATVNNPEPASMLLMAGGLAGLWRMKRRNKINS